MAAYVSFLLQQNTTAGEICTFLKYGGDEYVWLSVCR